MQQLQRKVMNIISGHDLFSSCDKIMLGVSGGPDSVALFKTLSGANTTGNIYSGLFIAHLNHLLRGEESEQDEQFVRGLAEESNISIIVERRDIRVLARERKMSIEEAARGERYKFLETAAQKVDANIVAVAHTADDNAETILHRIIRGTGILGIRGMSLRRKISQSSKIELVRPLLFSWRKDIIAYLEGLNIPYRNDSTNLETDKFRNRMRLELIPTLEERYNTGVKKSLIRLGEIANQNYNFLRSQADGLFERVLVNEDKSVNKSPEDIVLDITELKEMPAALQQFIIKEALIRMGVPLKKLGHNHYKVILDLIKSGKTLVDRCIKNYLIVCKDDKLLRLSRKKYHVEDKPVLERIELKAPGETKLDVLKYKVCIQVVSIKNGFLEEFKQNKSKYDEAVDFDKIELPISIRMRREGDRFWPLGSNGIKKLKDFFIDNKVPRMIRDSIPIIIMNGRPIWVVGYRIDDRVKITKETRTLLIMRVERYKG